MKRNSFAVFLCFLLLFVSNNFVRADAHGGKGCFACTLIVDLIEQLALLHSKAVEDILAQACSIFPTTVRAPCEEFIRKYGKYIIEGFIAAQNADQICLNVGLCTNPQCRLLPPRSVLGRAEKIPTNQLYNHPNWRLDAMKLRETESKSNPWEWIEEIIRKLAEKHEPVIDFDKDLFSIEPTLRGSNWRGRDCNDFDSHVYPGRSQNRYRGSGVDHNCNGIFGKDPNGKEWEETLCAGTGQMGVIVIGDSAGAHFEIPPEYLTASKINQNTFDNILTVVANEFDLPHQSAYTGFVDIDSEVPVNSLYKNLRARNLCNHRDYQNIAVNGARASPISKLAMALSRNATTDQPVLAVLELIGNDVCTAHPTLDRMTKPADFKVSILRFLDQFDTQVPSGSHLLIFGLVDGRLLWNALWNKTHPIGVTYQRVYDFLNCLETSPCWVWMNSDENIRNAGTARAVELNNVYREILKEFPGRWKNFDIAYYDFPADQILSEWARRGGETWQLIQAVDGFHPNGIFHSLLSDWIWDTLSLEHPQWLGNVNPNNDMIRRLFGNQGGH